MRKTFLLSNLSLVVFLLFIFLFSTHSFAENRELIVKYEDLMLILAAEAGDSNAQYELAEKYILGEGVKQNRHLAEKWLIHSILNYPQNKKSIELIEKEFNWHCVNGDYCTSIINNASIIHDKNLSWYWEINLLKMKDPKGIIAKDKQDIKVILKKYNVMNCNNRTQGYKTFQALDYDLRVVPKKDFIITDDEIEFKPLEPSAYDDKLFNYVCGQTNVDKKEEDVHEVSFGTGWPTQHGYVITNQHVISGKKKIMVVSTSGEKLSATVLIEDKINDLAVLQVEHPDKLPPALPIANASARIGSKVFTIGYPHPDVMGEKPKLTEGIINALSGYMDDPRILQISVPVQAGNSGGPLLSMNGEVVGIVTAKLSAVKMFNWTGDLPQNVNYAIKASYITALLKSVKEQSTVAKMLPVKRADLESLSSRIQNSVFLIIAELDFEINKEEKPNLAKDNEGKKRLSAIDWFKKGQAIIEPRQGGALDRWQEAIEAFTKAIELDPKYAAAYDARASIYGLQGMYDLAIKDYNMAIDLDPNNANEYTYSGRACAYRDIGNYQKAITDYSKAIELNPYSAGDYYARGYVYAVFGDYQQAIKDYSKTIELGFDPSMVYTKRAYAYEKTGNHQQAIKDYKTAAKEGDKEAEDYLKSKGIVW